VLFLALAAFLLLNKVDSPQYVIWLIPLAALARPRWGAFLFWQVTEIPLLVTRYLYFVRRSDELARPDATQHVGLNFDWFAGSVIVRDAALVFLMVLIVREVLRPGLDVVRRYGDDDPAGGVLDHPADHAVGRAPDRPLPQPGPWPAPAPV
jgi:uncharacterized membrane protein